MPCTMKTWLQAIGLASWQQLRGDKLVVPAWLSSLAQDAKVEAFASRELNQFVAPGRGQKSARDVILDMTGALRTKCAVILAEPIVGKRICCCINSLNTA